MKLTEEQIERAKTVNLPPFLMSHGFDLKKAGREYVWKEHDSLHIKDNGSGERGQWFRFSENKGGDNIDFLHEYMGMSFVEAVEALTGEHIDRTYTPSRTYEPQPEKKKEGVLKIEEADNCRRVFAYLCKTRGLDYDLISSLVKSGVIAQEEKTGNVLFKYFDENGKVIGAEKVGTSTEHKFKGIATGSAGGQGFEVVRGSGEKAFFFESAIDMLSYLQMHENELYNCRLVSMMGVKPNIVLDTMARHNISPENVYLCSDNDTAGNEFAQRLQEKYSEMKRIVTPDIYKDWNDMLRGISKQIKEVDNINMQYYGNEMWNKATDNRDKSLVTVRLSDFQRVQETLEKSGINYYAYEMNGAVRMAVNDKDIDWLRNILGNVNITKSNKPYSPPEKNIFGTAEYRYIPQKEYLTADRDIVLKTAEIMAQRGMQFSGRVYPSGKGTLTVSHADLYAVRSIRDEVTNMRKQFASPEKGEPVGNRDYRANRDTHYYMSKLTPEQFKEVKPFLETSVSYHAVSRDGKVAFAVDKENAPAFHRAFENAVREVGMLRNMSDLGLPMEQMIALSPVIHRLAVEDMKLNLADFFDKRYDEAQFGEMLSLVNAYLSQAPAERYGENSKLNDMLEAKSSFDRTIELSDFFSQHDFSDEQRAAITAMFVGDVTRGQIDSIDETFTAEDIQAYDEILHNALQESDVADFLTAHKQAVIDRENAARVPTEEEVLFTKADLAKFLAERSLSSDEWEDMAYPLFENGYLNNHKPNNKAILGYYMSEPAFYDLAHRYHNDEDIRRELALGLLEHTASEDIEFVFEDGKISGRTYYYADDLRHSLHTERTEDGYKCSFGGMERFVSFEEIGQAFIDRTHEEFEDLMYWRVLDYIRDDIPDISDETVQQLITAFDGAAMHGWEDGDNQPKLSRIKKAFACIAKQKYNVTFEAEKTESSIHFGLLGNGITAYDVSRTDKETNDYPTVAHISPEGVVRIYDDSLSAEDMERINEQAQLAREKFMNDWNMLSPVQQFQRLYDRADISTTVNINREKLSMEQTVEKYMPFVFFGEGERPEPEAEAFEINPPKREKEFTLEVGMTSDAFYEPYCISKIDADGDFIDYYEDIDGHIPTFSTIAEVLDFAEKHNLAVTNDLEEIPENLLYTLQDVVDRYFGTDCSVAETINGTWKLSVAEGDKVGELLYDGEPVCGIYNRGDKMEIESYQELTSFPKMLADAMLAHNPDKSVEIMDYQRTFETPLDKAKYLINSFCESEYDSQADFSDLREIHIAYTTLTDDELPIQVTADLVDFKIVYEFDGEVFNTEQYDSLEDMIENGLTGLDFSDLVSVPDSVIEKHIVKDELNTDDIDKPLFTDTSVIEEIQRNERSDTPFWETPDIQGEQLSLFGDPEPIQQKKPEKPKSEFAKGPVVDGVQVYEALAAEIDRGTGFVDGKLRVQEFFDEQHPTTQQLADRLKKEYGIGGHSGDGNISFVDYDSKGLTFSFKNGEKYRHSWYNVAVMTDARLKDNTYLSAEQQEKRQAQKEEKLADKTMVTPETEKSDIPTVKNLAQLKRSIMPGIMFEITDHLRPECIGERRVVTDVSTVDFTSRKLDENGEPMGKEIHMEFDKAANWTFNGNELASRIDENQVLMSFHFIDSLEREPYFEEISSDTIKYQITENADEQYKYNVQILTQGENGEFYYSGSGRFCETLDKAHAFIEHDKAERSADSRKDAPTSDKGDNFTITDDTLGEGGAKAKFKANIDAIRTLKMLEAENSPATDEEKEILSKDVGWGALAKAFDKSDPQWTAEYQELAELLTPEEYRKARASVNDAFYTSPTIIDGIYEALHDFGFEGGNVLEPVMGIGNFFGRMPEDMQSNSQLYGVEIDNLSGRIAQALYPDADIAIQGFEKNRFRNGSFDVAVGNVPFGELGFKDTVHDTTKLHDYFFCEALDKLKNGGIMAFVTSAGTLDKRDETTRLMLADKADFVGAIRLPGGKNGAFKDNAGTEVTTDIIFLKKHEGKSVAEMSDIPDWVHIGETADGLPINQYFASNPDMVLGTVIEGNKLYGSGTMVVAEDGFDLKTALHDAVSKLSAEISHEKACDVYTKTADGVQVQIPSNLRNYSFFMSDDQVFFKKNNTACEFRFDKGTAQHKR
ncbi:MAG: toprim domain-containing protein, partial [Alistipes sp.]|nr:toprim domain-containing protein [Alistipes sp.]